MSSPISSFAGSALQAVGTLLGGINAAATGRAVMRQKRMEADRLNMESGREAMSMMADTERAAASGFVNAAASGGATGSVFDVLDDFVATGLYNARAAVYRGQTGARNALFEGEVARQQGKAELIGSVFSAASSLVGGYGDYRSNRANSPVSKGGR